MIWWENFQAETRKDSLQSSIIKLEFHSVNGAKVCAAIRFHDVKICKNILSFPHRKWLFLRTALKGLKIKSLNLADGTFVPSLG